MTKSTQATEEAQVNTNREHDRAILPLAAGIAALLTGALLLWPSSAKAEGPPPSFEYVVGAFRAQLENPEQANQIRRLRRENRKLRKHVSSYGRWVRRQQRTIAVLREQSKLGWQVRNAIALASTAYGVAESSMLSVAQCESGLWPFATNGRYRGLFQEGPMFEAGPFGHLSVFDPYANAMTAAYTVRDNGSWRQWECKP